MNLDENQQPPRPQPNHHHFTFKFKPIHFLSIFILFLAISFTIPKSNHYYYTIHKIKSILPSHTTPFNKFLGFLHPKPKTLTPKPTFKTPNSCVLWMAPFLSGGGYSSEAWSYILALNEHLKQNPIFRLSIEQHGDLENLEFWEGLPLEMKKLVFELYQEKCRVNETIVVCHSEPGAWYPPLFETLPCPPTGYGEFKYVIGRTMFETDRVNDEHVKRCNQMDSIWVPTDFHVSTFVKSGVDPSKVLKVIQPVDLKFFDPLDYDRLDLSTIGSLVLGSNSPNSNVENQFVFLSVFKWEYRKGWDVLLRSYLTEFSQDDGVALYLLTNPYHSDSDFGNKIVDLVSHFGLERPVSGWAPIYVIDTHIVHVDLPRLYKAVNAFVLPSRGEGWGRPIVEAMAMALPVIATNWSGPTEYLTEENSYPLSVDKMSEVTEGPFKGHLWAEPCVVKLRVLMRRVMKNVEEAKAKGRRAREDMIHRFSPEIVAAIVSDHVKHILDKTG